MHTAAEYQGYMPGMNNSSTPVQSLVRLDKSVFQVQKIEKMERIAWF